ncbi:ATP-binding protein [Ideonella sp. BN130291]|uniref:ATP-binding protein n=1 Tax=Ideonella sp. BN130291 TaxID=3112940 RepID=UPI002E26EC5B|nr:AAA family ATPase [Ideonella sp. BN130291]
MELLERDALLAQLKSQQQAGTGRLILLEGEAGIGKTTLLRAFARAVQHEAPVYWGACDALLSPRPLAPLEDIALQVRGDLLALHRRAAPRQQVFVAFLELLSARRCVAVLEDLHWADEGTLDLLRYAGRRVARTGSLLLGSYRSDELVPSHPLRAVLGDLATSGALRLAPAPLSLQAVAALCTVPGADIAELHRKTAGNPFFVTEVLAAGADTVPATVQDAVLARASRLSPAAHALLEAAAVAGARAEPALLQALAGADAACLDECLATGVLQADGGVATFRHELARDAILRCIAPDRLVHLHRQALQALASSNPADPARLALHADGAGDAPAVRQWAPLAARKAAASGAHRQAAAHWAQALHHTRLPAERAALLDERATEIQMAGGLAEAIAARQEAARLWREAGRDGNAAATLARLALLLVLAGRNAEGEAALADAHRLLAGDPSSSFAAAVRRCAAGVRVLDRDSAEAIALAAPALAQAERDQDEPSMVHCLIMLGIAHINLDRVDEGVQRLEHALGLAERLHNDALMGQALANLSAGCAESLRLDQAMAYLQRGIAFCTDRDLDASRLYQLAWLAQVHLLRSRWDDADAAALEVLGDRRATTVARIVALTALGRLRARRGDPAAWQALDEARALADASGTVQRTAPLHAARAEAAWLEGRSDDALHDAAACLTLAIHKRQAALAGELLLWCRRAGLNSDIPTFCDRHPAALEAAGRWQDAARCWRELGCPFETARALAGGDEAAQREALALLETLGARPLAERVRWRLRAAGARGLPRGPRATTQQHPAGLTSKEVAVLALLASGLRNKDIAQRLSRSTRTIDHHLASIFTKLGVSTRAEAVSGAYRLGIVQAE